MEESRANQLQVSKKIPKADKYIPPNYVKLLYETVDNPRDRFYIMWHIETGVRVSDIVGQIDEVGAKRTLGQEINNIDWDDCKIWTYDFKKDKWRWVYFPKIVLQPLKMWLKERQNLEIKGRELFPYSEKTCNRILKRWCKKIEFRYADQVGSHWCRHTFIRLSRAADRDIKLVQQNTGDTIKTLLEWYADLSSDEIRNQMENKPLIRI